MLSKLDRLLDKMEIAFDLEDLKQPFSFSKAGRIVSLGDFIKDHGNKKVRSAFKFSGRAKSVRSVGTLNEEELKQVAVEILRQSNPHERMANSRGTFSPQELIEEVRQGTEVGKQFVSAIKQHSLFLEEALKQGRICRKESGTDLDLPDFEDIKF